MTLELRCPRVGCKGKQEIEEQGVQLGREVARFNCKKCRMVTEVVAW